jgi:zinc protease
VADCRAFHKRIFVPNNVVLTIVGDIDPDVVVKEVTRLTESWRPARLPAVAVPVATKPDAFTQSVTTMPNATQLQVYMGHIGVRRSNPDFYRLLVMDHVLGTGPGFTDRLSAKLRDRQGLGYTVSATITPSATQEEGVFSCYIGTYPDKLGAVKKAIQAEIRALREAPPSEAEVADAKQYLLGNIPFDFSTNERIATQLSDIEKYGLSYNYLDSFRREVMGVSPNDVRAVARKYLDPDRMFLIAVGPVDKDGQPLQNGGPGPVRPARPFRPKP